MNFNVLMLCLIILTPSSTCRENSSCLTFYIPHPSCILNDLVFSTALQGMFFESSIELQTKMG